MPDPIPFAWITKRDGRLVPFEADKISRALFAAGESLGRSDAFLARELTDGVLHFLAVEADGIPTTAQVADLVIKVVRELGQPALSQAFAQGQNQRPSVSRPRPTAVGPTPDHLSAWMEAGTSAAELARCAGRACLHAYSLDKVFARDLVAAHGEGLLTLTGLETPLQLDGCVLGPPVLESGSWRLDVGGTIAVVRAAQELAGQIIALDGPEHALARTGSVGPACRAGPGEEVPPGRRDLLVDDFATGLAAGLEATGLHAVVNLNSATPPPWAEDLAEGPLFAGQRQAPPTATTAALADALLEACLRPGMARDQTRIDWHLSDADFTPVNAARLLRPARLAAEGAPLTFVFDRSRRPLTLAEGLDRSHPAVLVRVGLHLPYLLEQTIRRAGGRPDADVFLQKLGSLARLALSAAVQKRAFLRGRRPALLNRGFLLDRARLVAVPVGLEGTVRRLLGDGGPEEAITGLARQTVQRLHDVLRQDGGACRLDTCVDSATTLEVEGLTFGNESAAPRVQVRTAGMLHGVAGSGTAAVVLPAGQEFGGEGLVELLRYAWQQTEVVRLRLVRAAAPPPADLPFV